MLVEVGASAAVLGAGSSVATSVADVVGVVTAGVVAAGGSGAAPRPSQPDTTHTTNAAGKSRRGVMPQAYTPLGSRIERWPWQANALDPSSRPAEAEGRRGGGSAADRLGQGSWVLAEVVGERSGGGRSVWC